jgi:hypothetical protein
VSIEYVEEDPTSVLAAIGVTVRDWESSMQLCVAEVPDDKRDALTALEDARGWFVNWKHARYMEFATATFVEICKKVLKDGSTPD